MKKVLIIFLSLFLFACGNTEPKIEEKPQVETEVKKPDLTFWEIQKMQKIKIGLAESFYYREKTGDWKYFDLNPRDGVEGLNFSKIVAGKVDFYQTTFADVNELKKYFSEHTREKYFLTHVEFPNNLSESDMLELVNLLDSERFDTNFMRPIRQIPAKFLANSEIVSKYNNLTENVKPITLYFNEFNNADIYNFHEKRQAFSEAKYDSKDIFINIAYWLGVTERDGFDVTQVLRLSNIWDLDHVLADKLGRNPPISVVSIGDGTYTKWLSAYADIREPLYDEQVFIKILQKLQNYKKFANELHIYGLKKLHFENEKILQILSEIEAKNIVFHLEHGSSFELDEKFYKKFLTAKTQKTIAFEVFGVGGEGEFFCNFIAENSEKSKIINRDGRPFLFCFAETAKIWDEEENKKREIRNEIAK